MRVELTEVLWLDQQPLSLQQLAEMSGLQPGLLRELLDCGVIAPLAAGNQPHAEPVFGAPALMTAREARRLLEDFELQPEGLALALQLLGRIDALEHQLRELSARLPRRIG